MNPNKISCVNPNKRVARIPLKSRLLGRISRGKEVKGAPSLSNNNINSRKWKARGILS